MRRFKLNLPAADFELKRNKNISIHFDRELKASTNTPAQKYSFTNTMTEHQKSAKGFALLWAQTKILTRYPVAKSDRPM